MKPSNVPPSIEPTAAMQRRRVIRARRLRKADCVVPFLFIDRNCWRVLANNPLLMQPRQRCQAFDADAQPHRASVTRYPLALASDLPRVSDQVEMTKQSPQILANEPEGPAEAKPR